MVETAPESAAASNWLSHSASFTLTFPTGMEPQQPERRGSAQRAAHMAARLWRLFLTFTWIIALVSSSRTRIYPPNEGEQEDVRHILVFRSWKLGETSLRARRRKQGESARKLHFGKISQLTCLLEILSMFSFLMRKYFGLDIYPVVL